MNKKILYLHVGWSKTGTSAVQSQAQKQRHDLLAKGILYPESLQWPDSSHHPFALAFKGDKTGGYNVDMSAAEAMGLLKKEMDENSTNSVLVSSELSPIYFHNPRFIEFVKENFDSVKVLFTVRLQSELLMSLMNQLVKDPNIRYRGSLFQLAMQNVQHLSFLKRVLIWERFVGKENVHCFMYSKNIVQEFLGFFGVDVKDSGDDIVVNKSVPNRILPLLQGLRADMTNQEYLDRTESLIKETETNPSSFNELEIFSLGEQRAFDNYFAVMNRKLENDYLTKGFPTKKPYRPVLAFA